MSLKTHAQNSQSLEDDRRRRCDWIVEFGYCIWSIYRVPRSSTLIVSVDDEDEEKVESVASEMKLLGSARSRKGESHSGWNVVGGNDVVDTWKSSGDIHRKRREKEEEKGDEETHSALMNERIVREPHVFCICNLFV